jgi:hypothetical protein
MSQSVILWDAVVIAVRRIARGEIGIIHAVRGLPDAD